MNSRVGGKESPVRKQGSVQPCRLQFCYLQSVTLRQEIIKHLEDYFEVHVYCFGENIRKKPENPFEFHCDEMKSLYQDI